MKFISSTLAALAAFSFQTASSKTIGDIVIESPDHMTLEAAVDTAGLGDALQGDGPLTLFAPNDAAFGKLDSAVVAQLLMPEWKSHLQCVLLYHVLEGKILSTDLSQGQMATTLEGSDVTVTSIDPVQINEVDVVAANINATNGVIHVLDEVLLPTCVTTDIVDIAVSLPDKFSTLVSLVTAAELGETLKSPGPFTVLAPTNEAFSKVDPDTLEFLGKPENKDVLVGVLTHHVIAGITTSDELTNGAMVTTVQGSDVTVSVDGETVMFNDATVEIADVLASNGVIHAIDTVLIPPTEAPVAPTTAPVATPTDMPTTSGSFLTSVSLFGTMAAVLVTGWAM